MVGHVYIDTISFRVHKKEIPPIMARMQQSVCKVD
jgi:hypothetical protein